MKNSQFFILKTSLFLTLINLLSPSWVMAHQVIESKGEVKAKRAGSEVFRPITVGTSVHSGDILYPSANSRVLILCDSGAVWQVTPGIPAPVNANCPPSPVGKTIRSGFLPIISQQDKNLPYLISPRYTRLKDSYPFFRWNSVAGTKRYKVQLLANTGLVHWATTTEVTEIQYPKNAPPLEPNVNYLLIVETDSGASSLQDAGGILGFFVLSPEKIKTVEQEIQKALQDPNLDTATKAFIQARIYQNYGLFQDSIDMINKKLQTQSRLDPDQTALLHTLLGDLYNQIGLTQLAEQHFSESATILQKSSNQLAFAETLEGLATVQWLNRQTEQAKQNEQIVLEIYEKQGDSERQKQFEQVIEDAKTYQPSSLPPRDLIDLGAGITTPDQIIPTP